MFAALKLRVPLLALFFFCGFAGAQQAADALRYSGTVGQQQVALVLQVEGDALRGGYYSYDRQKGDIRLVDSRRFGTTLVLQDEDGNILHLHFEDAAGEKTGSLDRAALLEGTLDRGELDLPVRLKRLPPDTK